MKARNESICFDALIERIAQEVPRFVVYPGKAWDETGTFIVDVSLNGIPIGLRSLIPWKERGWHFGLSQPMCNKVGVETGDRVSVEMRRPGDARPQELKDLLKSNPRAQKGLECITARHATGLYAARRWCEELGDANAARKEASGLN